MGGSPDADFTIIRIRRIRRPRSSSGEKKSKRNKTQRHRVRRAEKEKEKMAYENLLYEKKGGIAYITFNRPKVLNALNRKTIEELQNALRDARDDQAVRVLILTGGGEKAFVAGADISELALQTPVNGKEFSLFGQSVFHLLETMGKPSICAINGFALGSGWRGCAARAWRTNFASPGR